MKKLIVALCCVLAAFVFYGCASIETEYPTNEICRVGSVLPDAELPNMIRGCSGADCIVACNLYSGALIPEQNGTTTTNVHMVIQNGVVKRCIVIDRGYSNSGRNIMGPFVILQVYNTY